VPLEVDGDWAGGLPGAEDGIPPDALSLLLATFADWRAQLATTPTVEVLLYEIDQVVALEGDNAIRWAAPAAWVGHSATTFFFRGDGVGAIVTRRRRTPRSINPSP
jgi:hypothetical protein